MNPLSLSKSLLIFTAVSTLLFSCKKDDDETITPDKKPEIQVPATYEFLRNNESSVSYSGQTDRLNQLSEIKTMLKKGDNGEVMDKQALLDMYANVNDNGNGNFSFSSSKQLKDKTFALDVDWFVELLENAADASQLGTTAGNGTAGLLQRSNGSQILVNENGREFTQLFEKGTMGATFLNQIFNTYLTNEKIGEAVENTALAEGKNYTTLEHHMDEAFGYFGAPVDFSSDYSGSGDPKFLAGYSEEMDPITACSDKIMNAFKTARAAIVAKDHVVKTQQVNILYKELEKLAASVAIHYVNESMEKTNDGDRMHVMSEGYGFIRALRYQHAKYRKLSQAEVDELLNLMGDNFWETSESDLNIIKSKLSTTYGLESVKDIL